MVITESGGTLSQARAKWGQQKEGGGFTDAIKDVLCDGMRCAGPEGGGTCGAGEGATMDAWGQQHRPTGVIMDVWSKSNRSLERLWTCGAKV